MFVIVVAVFVVHMTIMQVVSVTPMIDLGVTTVLTVHMVMILMYYTIFIRHRQLTQFCCLTFSV
jgi:hypothetical protein